MTTQNSFFQMKYHFQSIQLLRIILVAPGAVVEDFKTTLSGKNSKILGLHIPFQFLFPVAILLSPFGPLFRGRLNYWKLIPVALAIVWLSLLVAFTLDRILEFGPSPESRLYSDKRPSGMALLLHLPVSASGIFFFFHPMFGFLMLGLSIFYSINISLKEIATLLSTTKRTLLRHYLSAILFWFIPLFVFLALFNLSRTFKIFFSLDWFQ